MSTCTTLTPPLLVPTGDRAPVEQAVAESITAEHPAESYLWIEFHRPDGGVGIVHAWTAGGDVLGDHVDSVAVAAGLDAADWLELTIRHQQVSTRGRVTVKAHPLRPLLAAVQAGARCDEDFRGFVLRALELGAQTTDRQASGRVPHWLGVGPRLATRRN